MIGRAAYSNPFLFAALDREFFGSTAEEVSRRDVVLRMVCRTIFTLCVASANSDQGHCNVVRWNMRKSRWKKAKSCGASYDTCSACTPTCPEVKPTFITGPHPLGAKTQIPGAKNWKKHLSERHAKTTTPLRPDVLLEALELTNHAALSSLPLAWQAQSAATSAAHP
jgi:hypothetical protein